MHLFTRFRRRLTAAIAVGALLFAQGAIAAHACLQGAVQEVMPCEQHAAEAVVAASLLCRTHCVAETQILDLAKIPLLAPSELPVLVFAGVVSAAFVVRAPAVRPQGLSPSAAPPPLTVLLSRFLI
jgi:hypothetical protein